MSRTSFNILIVALVVMLVALLCSVADACWRRARSHCCYHTSMYAQLQAKYALLSEKYDDVVAERDQLDENLAVLQAQYDEMKDQYDGLSATYDTLSEEHEQLKKAYNDLLQGQLPPDIAKYREAIKAFQAAHEVLLTIE